jgi:hypothetical protein
MLGNREKHPIVEWEYCPADNPLSDILENLIIEHRERTRSHAPYTFLELVRLAKHGATEEKPVMPFYLVNEDARKAAIRERGPDAVRDEFHTFKTNFQAYEEKTHQAKAALDLLKNRSLDGEITPQGYRDYLSSFEADLPFLFGIRKLPLPEYMRKTHTYITAGSGMGKSTVLRDMAYHYAKDAGTSLVVIDPHGSLAEAIARFDIPGLDDRLIYFHPYLGKGVFPVLNPLETKNKDPRIVSIAAEEFVRQFRILLRDADNTTSQQMESILRPCVKALMLREKPSTLTDLAAFLEPENKEKATESLPYFEEARRILPNPADRHFLETDFYSAGYKQTKLSIRTRLRMLMGSDAIYRCVNGASTIDLRKAINTPGSVILFNLSGVGQEVTDTLGRFFTGMMQSFAMECETIPEEFRPQTHFFIDECQRFVNASIEKILTESRKYGLYLTLAQQIVGNGMDGDLERVVLGNSGIKVCGFNEHKSLGTMSKNMGIAEAELKTLRRHEFYARGTEIFPFRFKTSNIERFISPEAWKARKARQLAQFYRSPDDSPRTSQDSTASSEFNHQI